MTVRILTSVAILSAATGLVVAQEKKPSHIFDFGGFDDEPTTQPTVQRRNVPARKPVPGVIEAPAAPQAPRLPPPTVVTPPDSGIPEPTVPQPPTEPAAPQAPALPAAPVAVPPAAAADAAMAKLRSQHSAELAASADRLSRRSLALKIAAIALAPGAADADRHAAGLLAVQTATASGDVSLTLGLLDAFVRQFAVDELWFRSAIVLEMAAKATAAVDAHALATATLPLIDAATREDDFTSAEKLTAAAEQCAVRAAPRDVVLLGQVRVAANEMRSAKVQFEASKPALDAIAGGSASPAMKTSAGRYLCFVKNEWQRGLPLLAAGDDAALKSVAAKDVALPAGVADRKSLADAWWNVAAAEPAPTRPRVLDRAATWYRVVLAQLPVQERIGVQSRITMAASALKKIEPGLVAEVYYDPGMRIRQRVRIDPNIAADYSAATTDALVDREVFAIRWTGHIKIPKTGVYQFNARVKESMRIWIDGSKVLSADNPKDKATFGLMLVEGLHEIRIHYNSRGSKSHAKLSWTSEGQFTDQVIGPQYFFHDARAGAEYLSTGSLAADYLDRTYRMGGFGGGFYDDVSPDAPGLLVGFHITTGGRIIRSVQPVFQNTADQVSVGRVYGGRGDMKQSAVARPGYAVASITAKGGDRLNGFKVTFAKVKPDRTLNLADVYDSEWLGGTGGGKETLIGGDGRPVVGICGRCGADVDSMGLILRGAAKNAADAIVMARYGNGDKWADVTSKVRNLIRDGAPVKATHTALNADPLPGKPKVLEITYTENGQKKSITIQGGDTIAIPGIFSR